MVLWRNGGASCRNRHSLGRCSNLGNEPPALNLLRILDPERYDKEIESFPRSKLKDAAVVSLLSYGNGKIKEGTNAFVHSLPHLFVPAPFYEITDQDPIVRTKDLNSIAATVTFVGPTEEVRRSAVTLARKSAAGRLFNYERPSSLVGRCAFTLGHLAHRIRIGSRLRTMRWDD